MSFTLDFFSSTQCNINTAQKNYKETEILYKKFYDIVESKESDFFTLFSLEEDQQLCENFWKNHSFKKCLIYIGIGGSSLGPKVCFEALKYYTNATQENSLKECFFFESVCPFEQQKIQAVLEKYKLEEIILIAASKSGQTLETTFNLSWALSFLSKKYGEKIIKQELPNLLAIVSDPQKSPYKDWAEEFQLSFFPLTSNLGGRFSVLSNIGFLVWSFLGIDLTPVVKNLRNCQKEKKFLEKVALMAQFIIEQRKENYVEFVCMPYCSILERFSDWFVQLWAESLGKKENFPCTPLRSLGPNDQHSLLQLFMEGPKSKILNFISVKEIPNISIENFILPPHKNLKNLELFGKSVSSQVLQGLLEGTKMALEEVKRPWIHLEMESLTPENLAEVFFFYQALVVMLGGHYGISCFDQPGVELSKIKTKQWQERRRI